MIKNFGLSVIIIIALYVSSYFLFAEDEIVNEVGKNFYTSLVTPPTKVAIKTYTNCSFNMTVEERINNHTDEGFLSLTTKRKGIIKEVISEKFTSIVFPTIEDESYEWREGYLNYFFCIAPGFPVVQVKEDILLYDPEISFGEEFESTYYWFFFKWILIKREQTGVS